MDETSAAAVAAAVLGAADARTWVFAGDSVTQGAVHTLGWRDYTELVRERVGWELRRTRDIFINTGVSGWRVPDFAADLDRAVLRHRPDLVFVMFGLNDAVAGPAGRADFASAYRDVLAEVRQRTGAPVILQVPNPAISSEADLTDLPAYAAEVRSIASELGLPLVDHDAAWAELVKTGPLEQWIGAGCHPNECGHRAMARTLLSAIGAWDETSLVGRLYIP